MTSRPGSCLAVVASRLRPRVGGVEPVDRREGRQRAAGEHDGPARLELLVAGDDPALAGDAPARAHERDALLLQPRQLGGVVEVVDDLVAAVEHGLDVERARRRLLGALDAADLVERLGRAQQRL